MTAHAFPADRTLEALRVQRGAVSYDKLRSSPSPSNAFPIGRRCLWSRRRRAMVSARDVPCCLSILILSAWTNRPFSSRCPPPCFAITSLSNRLSFVSGMIALATSITMPSRRAHGTARNLPRPDTTVPNLPAHLGHQCVMDVQPAPFWRSGHDRDGDSCRGGADLRRRGSMANGRPAAGIGSAARRRPVVTVPRARSAHCERFCSLCFRRLKAFDCGDPSLNDWSESVRSPIRPRVRLAPTW
jgi:hypothetical protein